MYSARSGYGRLEDPPRLLQPQHHQPAMKFPVGTSGASILSVVAHDAFVLSRRIPGSVRPSEPIMAAEMTLIQIDITGPEPYYY
jgi:hypothetical protein